MNISLIGFMAAGKSTLGKSMAEQSGKRLICIDEEIEREAGKPISEIFKLYGESYFRTLEREKLIETFKSDEQIIDCGGGAAIYNQELIRDNSYIIFVDTDFEVIWDRLNNDTLRPVATNKSKEQLLELYNRRREIYLRISNEVIS